MLKWAKLVFGSQQPWSADPGSVLRVQANSPFRLFCYP